MALYEQIKMALDGAGISSVDRNYWNTAPDSPTSPYSVLSTIASVPENTLNGRVAITNSRVQIDAYARTYVAAQALAGEIQAAMSAAPFSNVLLMAQDVYEDVVKLHRVTMDFSIWA